MLERPKSAFYQQEMLLECAKITLYQQDMPHQQDVLLERQKSTLYQQEMLIESAKNTLYQHTFREGKNHTPLMTESTFCVRQVAVGLNFLYSNLL